MKVCVMGLGKVGLPVANHVSRYFPTVGYDISEKAVARASEKGVKASTVLEVAEVYVVAVNTWFRNNVPDMSAVDDCCCKIGQVNPNALVCIESTLSVGAARKMAWKYGRVNAKNTSTACKKHLDFSIKSSKAPS